MRKGIVRAIALLSALMMCALCACTANVNAIEPEVSVEPVATVSTVAPVATVEPLAENPILAAGVASPQSDSGEKQPNTAKTMLQMHDEARIWGDYGIEYDTVFPADKYRKDDISTYKFDETTVFEGSEEYAAGILEQGKDPGLGVRALHDQGITGEGVNVAIID